MFLNYHFRPEYIETMLRNYTYLNTGLSIYYNGHRIVSRNGLEDLLNDNMTSQGLYPIVHLKDEDIEIALLIVLSMERNIIRLSTDSIQLRVVRTKVLSRSILHALSRNSMVKIWNFRIFATGW